MRGTETFLALVLVATSAACSGETGSADAGGSPDAEPRDASNADATIEPSDDAGTADDGGGALDDAAVADAAHPDGSMVDGGATTTDAGDGPDLCGNNSIDPGEVCDEGPRSGGTPRYPACDMDCTRHNCARYGPDWVEDAVTHRCLALATSGSPVYDAEGLVWWRDTAERDRILAIYQSQVLVPEMTFRAYVRAQSYNGTSWFWDLPGRPPVTDLPWATGWPYAPNRCAALRFMTTGEVSVVATDCYTGLGLGRAMVREPPPVALP